MDRLDDADRERVDEALQAWRQGDCVVGEHWFLFRTDLTTPLTEAGTEAAQEGADNSEAAVAGFMVVTQTCDIVRSCVDRPFVEVSPLVEVKENVMREIERCKRPQYAFVSGLGDQGLVADLDRVMTVEKSVITRWTRVKGCLSPEDTRRLSLALARKRARVAFPDDFVTLVQPLMSRMSTKHDKDSEEGKALRALREIRVRAAPSWEAKEVELTMWFIREEDEPTFGGRRWDEFLDSWLERVPEGGRFVQVQGLVATLDDLTARDYVESDPLDLDHLSTRPA